MIEQKQNHPDFEPKPVFMTVAAKLVLNVHDLNNEATAGNVTDIRMIKLVDEEGKELEAPAVSGRMLKHFHAAHMTDQALLGSTTNLCDACREYEPIRPGKKEKGEIKTNVIPEDQAVQGCIICDTHGYLLATKPKAEGEKGTSNRRTSRAMFSWLLPMLLTDTPAKQVVHTRVSRQEAPESEEIAAQMLYYKSYASGVYGFVSGMDLGRIGYLELGSEYAITKEEWKKRAKIAVESYRTMLTGNLGASMSHAVPHAKCIELLIALSETEPIPFPVSPIYGNYAQEYVGILKGLNDVTIYGYNVDEEGITQKETIGEIFEEIKRKIDQA